MFTPPPSPHYQCIHDSSSVDTTDAPTNATFSHHALTSRKRLTALRTKWTVILIPLALMVISLSSRYLVTPAVSPEVAEQPSIHPWRDWTLRSGFMNVGTLRRHRRQRPSPTSSPPSISFPSDPASSANSQDSLPTPPSTTTTAALTLPTIPTAPPTLPTPFPQPLDTSITRNFSNAGCYTFIQNMTNTPAFRSCRPFSLLLQSSAAFIQGQNNITELNNVVWGTCNPNPGIPQCTSNMAWFADHIKTECKDDLAAKNVVATNTLLGLQTYGLMAQAGCLADPSTSTYCYIKAVYSKDPSDLYFYQIPIGIKLPPSTHASCSACTKSLMALYSQALRTGGDAGGAGSLGSTYDNAAASTTRVCGKGFVVESSGAGRKYAAHGSRWAVTVMALVWMIWLTLR